MGQDTHIQWTDATWNPVRGCSKVSPGCKNCYAEKVAARFCGPGLPYEGLADPRTKLWTGKVRMVPEHLADPLRWRRPRRIFVNSMSDLFHESLSDEQIASVFGIMAGAPHHTFQVLTKRAERMRRWFARDTDHATECGEAAARAMGDSFSSFSYGAGGPWPLPNVWLGVSVEDQKRAEERIPQLVRTPAAVRFLSIEPQLGPVDLQDWLVLPSGHAPYLHWVIVGGESGPDARAFSLRWAHSIVKQCAGAGVALFVKQLGSRPASPSCASIECEHPDCGPGWLSLKNKKGGDPEEWPEGLRVREFPEVRR